MKKKIPTYNGGYIELKFDAQGNGRIARINNIGHCTHAFHLYENEFEALKETEKLKRDLDSLLKAAKSTHTWLKEVRLEQNRSFFVPEGVSEKALRESIEQAEQP